MKNILIYFITMTLFISCNNSPDTTQKSNSKIPFDNEEEYFDVPCQLEGEYIYFDKGNASLICVNKEDLRIELVWNNHQTFFVEAQKKGNKLSGKYYKEGNIDKEKLDFNAVVAPSGTIVFKNCDGKYGFNTIKLRKK